MTPYLIHTWEVFKSSRLHIAMNTKNKSKKGSLIQKKKQKKSYNGRVSRSGSKNQFRHLKKAAKTKI